MFLMMESFFIEKVRLKFWHFLQNVRIRWSLDTSFKCNKHLATFSRATGAAETAPAIGKFKEV